MICGCDFFALSLAFISIQTNVFMSKRIKEHQIVYNGTKVLHGSSLFILLSNCTKLMHLTIKCTKVSYGTVLYDFLS